MSNGGIQKRKIYKRHRPLKIVLLSLLALVALLVILFISVFFSFKKYIVYTDDGLYLDIPWLERNVESVQNPID